MKFCIKCKKGYISNRKYQERELEFAGRSLVTGDALYNIVVNNVSYDFCSNVLCNWSYRDYTFSYYEKKILKKDLKETDISKLI